MAMGLLLLAKVATVYIPIVYGRIVDALAPKDATAMLAIPMALVIAYVLHLGEQCVAVRRRGRTDAQQHQAIISAIGIASIAAIPMALVIALRVAFA